MKPFVCFFGACLTAFVGVAGAAAAQEVGRVELVRVYGYETAPSADRAPIFARDSVVANTLLETVRDGRLDVRFIDDTKLIVGPGSEVRIDRFVFDPNPGAGAATLNMTRGVMRFVTGRMASQAYSVRTPTATLGVRGTDFVVQVDGAGATTVSVLDGEVEFQPNDGDGGSVSAGNTGSSAGAGVSVTATVGLPALSTATFGADDDVDGPDGNDDGDEEEEESEGIGGEGNVNK